MPVYIINLICVRNADPVGVNVAGLIERHPFEHLIDTTEGSFSFGIIFKQIRMNDYVHWRLPIVL